MQDSSTVLTEHGCQGVQCWGCAHTGAVIVPAAACDYHNFHGV